MPCLPECKTKIEKENMTARMHYKTATHQFCVQYFLYNVDNVFE